MKKKNKSLCYLWSQSVMFYVKSLTKTLPELERLYKESNDLYSKGDIKAYEELRSIAFALDQKWYRSYAKYTDHVKHLSMKAEKTHRTRPQKRHEAIWLNFSLAVTFKYEMIHNRSLDRYILSHNNNE